MYAAHCGVRQTNPCVCSMHVHRTVPSGSPLLNLVCVIGLVHGISDFSFEVVEASAVDVQWIAC